MKTVLCTGIALVALVWIAGCAPATHAGDAPAPVAATLQFRGEIVHLTLEGGFWGIVAEDGRRYDAGRLPPEFQQPGLKVWVSAKPVPGRVSFRMWGTPIELVHIERTEPR
jgi:hypothetical protein